MTTEYSHSKWYQALLTWLNTFQFLQTPLTSLSQLSDSAQFKLIIEESIPVEDLVKESLFQDGDDTCEISKNHKQNFCSIVTIFSEFFNFPLEDAISLEKLLNNDDVEIIKLVLIFLAFAVQQKPNEEIIGRIILLSIGVQVTLSRIIEVMFKRLGNKEIDIIRDFLIISEIEDAVIIRDADLNSGMDTTPEKIYLQMATQSISPLISPTFGDSSNNCTLQTPSESSKKIFGITDRYYGFDSPAVKKWVNQPEIKRSMSIVTVSKSSSNLSIAPSDEISALRYKFNQQQEELESLRLFCEEKDEEMTGKYELINTLKIQITNLESELRVKRDLLDERQVLAEQFERISNQNKHMKQEVEQLKDYKKKCNEFAEIIETTNIANKENKSLLRNIESIQLELINEKEKFFDMKQTNMNMEIKLTEYQASIETLETEKSDTMKTLETAWQENVQLKNDLALLKDSKIADSTAPSNYFCEDSKNSDEIALLFKVKSLEDENEDLKTMLPKIKELEVKKLEVKRVEDELSTALEYKETLNNMFKDTKAENIQLNHKLCQFNKYKTEVTDLNAELTNVKNELMTTKSELESQISKYRIISTQNQLLEATNDRIDRENNSLKCRIESLDLALVTTNEALIEYVSEKEIIIGLKESAEKELNDKNNQFNLLQEKITHATKELENVSQISQEDRKTLIEKNSELRDTNFSMESQLKLLETRFSTTKQELKNKEEKLGLIQKQLVEKEDQYQASATADKAIIYELKNELTKAQCDYTNLQCQLEEQIRRLQEELKIIENDSGSSIQAKKDLEQKLEENFENSRQKEITHRENVSQLHEQIHMLTEKNLILESKCAQYNQIAEESSEYNSDYINQMKEKIEILEKKLAYFGEKTEQLENEKAKLINNTRSLEVQLQFAETQIRESKKNNNSDNKKIPLKGVNKNLRTHSSTNISPPKTAPCNSAPNIAKTSISISTSYNNMPSILGSEDAPERTKEIQRRNAINLPHLKSSYPIEFQNTKVEEKHLQTGKSSPSTTSSPQINSFKLAKTSLSNTTTSNDNFKRPGISFNVDAGNLSKNPVLKLNKQAPASYDRTRIVSSNFNETTRANKAKLSASLVNIQTQSKRKK